MKHRSFWFLLPCVALALSACDKKDAVNDSKSDTAVPSASGQPDPAAASATKPTEAALGLEDRAELLGFARYAPANSEAILSVQRGSEVFGLLSGSTLGQMARDANDDDADSVGPTEFDEFEADEMEANGSDDAQDLAEADLEDSDDAVAETLTTREFFGKETTLVMGKQSSEQLSHLLRLNNRSTFFQMKAIVKAFAAASASGSSENFSNLLAQSFSETVFKELLQDPESGIDLFTKMNMPPVTFAVRATPSTIEEAAQMMAQPIEGLAMFGSEVMEPISIERHGSTFTGLKLLGSAVADLLEADRESMEEEISKETTDQLIAAIREKNLVWLSGAHEDYALFFMGSSEEDFQLAGKAEESYAANQLTRFVDGYADKKLVSYFVGDEALKSVTLAANESFAAIVGGISEGLGESSGLGDVRDLQALLDLVLQRERSVRSLSSQQPLQMIAFLEDGFKVETYGGSQTGAIDYQANATLGHLAEMPDVALFSHMTSDETYNRKASEYFEALLETVYAISRKVSEQAPMEGDLGEFREMANVFETDFRADVVSVWEALSGEFSAGVGRESALIVDLKGALPPFPGIPQSAVDQPVFPRVSIIYPVVDREKVAESWTSINDSMTRILGKVSEMTGKDFPMQKPLSAEKNELMTWFFSVPFANDDFLPSATLNDDWLALSSSRSQAADVVALASKGGKSSPGFQMLINFRALETFANSAIELSEANPDAMPINEEQLETIRETAKAMEEFDSLRLRTFEESGVGRCSIHFKTR